MYVSGVGEGAVYLLVAGTSGPGRGIRWTGKVHAGTPTGSKVAGCWTVRGNLLILRGSANALVSSVCIPAPVKLYL